MNKHCRSCDQVVPVVAGPGSGPHYASQRCPQGHFLGWMPKPKPRQTYAEFIKCQADSIAAARNEKPLPGWAYVTEAGGEFLEVGSGPAGIYQL